ncbi:alpha/beta hydrolase [Acidovorax sp. BLS4]|uniref:alpha/beta hydrolase n=1 Tax=Acidovorax sp. BLS4 TaxID=3273430 RepID=UPI002943AF85|nr:alpha/beta hydrolase [Paracidovorax avenae]WOI47840.1 alpha/beta hydrolase [Paracidovorax avenae]
MVDPDAPSTLSPFTAADGENLALQDWPLPHADARATVLLVHGLGEHVGRYDRLARRLNAWGFAVRGYDQYGHGESGGLRGALTPPNRLMVDLADIVDATRARMPPGQPLVLLGHSLGGLVAASFVAQALRPVEALVLSSPALDPGLSWTQKFLVATLPRVLPNLRLATGIDPAHLSHDPAVIAAYRADPRCHDRVGAGLARFIAYTGPAVVARAAQWSVPTLLMWAGADRLVNPAGSRAFARAAPPGVVHAQEFALAYHELFKESPEHAAPVFAALQQWLDARCPAPAAWSKIGLQHNNH